MLGDIASADMKPPENVLFVCKLNPMTDDDDLTLIFSRFDPLAKADVIRDPDTGDSLQYAFVEFETKEACNEAYFKMNNTLIDDRRIKVDFSQSVAKEWNRYTQRKQGGRGAGGMEGVMAMVITITTIIDININNMPILNQEMKRNSMEGTNKIMTPTTTIIINDMIIIMVDKKVTLICSINNNNTMIENKQEKEVYLHHHPLLLFLLPNNSNDNIINKGDEVEKVEVLVVKLKVMMRMIVKLTRVINLIIMT